jgi:hypothetical protein
MRGTAWTIYLGYFLLSCVAWYSAVIVAGVLSLLPLRTEIPDNLFRMYWASYYSETSEKGFCRADPRSNREPSAQGPRRRVVEWSRIVQQCLHVLDG